MKTKDESESTLAAYYNFNDRSQKIRSITRDDFSKKTIVRYFDVIRKEILQDTFHTDEDTHNKMVAEYTNLKAKEYLRIESGKNYYVEFDDGAIAIVKMTHVSRFGHVVEFTNITTNNSFCVKREDLNVIDLV